MNRKILVSISIDSTFVSFRTFSRETGNSPRFVMFADRFNKFIESDEYSFFDRDLNNILTVTKSTDNMLRFEVFYLDHSNNKLNGYSVEFFINKAAFMNSGKYICNSERTMSTKLNFSSDAHRLIAELNKQQKRALSKSLRNRFGYCKSVDFYRDLGVSFYFRDNNGSDGGLVMHVSENNGTASYSFSIHT